MPISYIDDLNFESEVINSDKPVLIDFCAQWCGPCKMLSPLIEEASEIYSDKIKFVQIDTDESPNTAEKYNVKGIPNILFIKNGEPSARSIGYIDQIKLKKFIEDQLQ